MKNLIHKTLKKNYESIKENGFKIRQDEYGRFGYGVYFMVDEDFGEYGDGLSVICDVDDEYMYEMTDEKIKILYPEVYFLEGGAPEIQNYVKQRGYVGVIIPYSSGEIEVVVYDTSIIKIKDFVMK